MLVTIAQAKQTYWQFEFVAFDEGTCIYQANSKTLLSQKKS